MDEAVALDDVVEGFWVDFGGEPGGRYGDDAFEVDVVGVEQKTDLRKAETWLSACLVVMRVISTGLRMTRRRRVHCRCLSAMYHSVQPWPKFQEAERGTLTRAMYLGF